MKTLRTPKTPIKSIRTELAQCRKAFRTARYTNFAWCCHHAKLIEILDGAEPKDRIEFIQKEKSLAEQAIRFRNFRPVKNIKLNRLYSQWQNANNRFDYPQVRELFAEIDKLRWAMTQADFDREWPDNTWNGASIF